MHCENCGFYHRSKVRNHSFCDITNIVNPKGCTYEYKPDLKICYNCKHWIGYKVANKTQPLALCELFSHKVIRNNSYANGFTKACNYFEVRNL